MEYEFRGKIAEAFSIPGRGTVVTIRLDIEGQVKPGDPIAVPLRSGRMLEVVVRGIEYIDSIRTVETMIGLLIGSLDPQSVLVGGYVTGPVAMKHYAQEAENLRLLFDAGIASVDDVVAWADRTILTLPEYDDDLTEISLGAKVPMIEMDSRLRRVSWGADTFEAIRNLAGRMHQALLLDRSRARDFARVLESIWIDCSYEVPNDLAFMAGIDDTFSLAESGTYGSVDGAIDNLIAETARFDVQKPNEH